MNLNCNNFLRNACWLFLKFSGDLEHLSSPQKPFPPLSPIVNVCEDCDQPSSPMRGDNSFSVKSTAETKSWSRVLKLIFVSRDSTVGMATAYGLDDRRVGVRVPVGSRIFPSLHRPDRLWGPPSLLSNRCRGALSPGIKRQGRKADHSPPASAEVKKMWIYTSTPLYAFIA
jgi:hypothetical protein